MNYASYLFKDYMLFHIQSYRGYSFTLIFNQYYQHQIKQCLYRKSTLYKKKKHNV